jgi:hypothetical protein
MANYSGQGMFFDAAEFARQQEIAKIEQDNIDRERGKGKYYVAPTPSPAPANPVAAPVPTPPPPAPVLPRFVPLSNVNKNFKVAPSDIIQFNNDAVDIALIQQLLFEDIGAVELANISRSDLIDGQPAVYAPIANLSTLNREFNPNNIIATSNNLDYFSRFGLDLSSRGINEPYFNDNGDLVIEIDTVYDGEELQVEILTNGTINLVGDV